MSSTREIGAILAAMIMLSVPLLQYMYSLAPLYGCTGPLNFAIK